MRKVSYKCPMMSGWNFALADKIDAVLKEKNISQKELAKRMGKTEAEVSCWHDETHNFTLLTIARISSALGSNLIIICISNFNS